MNTNRYRMAIGAIAITMILAACGVQAAPEPTSPASPTLTAAPSEAPSEAPSADPDVTPDVDGTITVAEGAAFSGPGISVSGALANPTAGPMLVNGALWLAPDGTLYLSEAVDDASVPTFAGPTLEVLNFATVEALWDPANPDVVGLREAGGIPFFESYQILGTIES
ncbi:MAG: hypothetical protein K5924_04070 [Chloroflexi bacterium]|nr:hypothetical protein [Chloroflexota bacterium]